MKQMFATAVLLASAVGGSAMAQLAIDSKAQLQSEAQELRALLVERENANTKPRSVADAIVRLGELKHVEDVLLLISYIDFKHPDLTRKDFTEPSEKNYIGKTQRSILDGYVAANALISMGEPSIEKVLESCKKEKIEHKLRLLAAVLYGVKGHDKARALIDSELAKVNDAEVKHRLEIVRKYLDGGLV